MVARAAPPAAAIAAGPPARSQQTLGATLPPEIQRLRAWAAGRIERGTVDSDGQFTGQEFAELYRARLAHAYMFGDMPLIVIIARKRQIPQNLPPEWAVPNEEIDHQDEELAGLSRQGRFIYAENSTHMVPDDEPSVVIKAIHEVVDASAAARKN